MSGWPLGFAILAACALDDFARGVASGSPDGGRERAPVALGGQPVVDGGGGDGVGGIYYGKTSGDIK